MCTDGQGLGGRGAPRVSWQRIPVRSDPGAETRVLPRSLHRRCWGRFPVWLRGGGGAAKAPAALTLARSTWPAGGPRPRKQASGGQSLVSPVPGLPPRCLPAHSSPGASLRRRWRRRPERREARTWTQLAQRRLRAGSRPLSGVQALAWQT